jgi:hypothetical protein
VFIIDYDINRRDEIFTYSSDGIVRKYSHTGSLLAYLVGAGTGTLDNDESGT